MNIDNNTANTNFIEEVEEKLLSIFLSDHNSAVKGNAFLTPKDFSKPQNTAIFNAIKDLVENNKTVDALTTKSYFDAHPNIQFVDFSKYITKLTMQFSSIAGLDEYIEIVKDASIKRNLDKVCHDIIESKFSFTNFDKEISKKINAFNDIAWDRKTNDAQDIAAILKQNLSMMNLQHVDNVVETGFPTMDKILSGGLEKGEVTLVAAAPSVGKSTLALNIFANECEKLAYTPTNPNAKKQLVYYVSLEMTQAQIIERLISMKALKNFRFSDYKEKKYSDSDNDRFLHAMGEIEKYPAFINANFKASINDIRNQISQLSNSYDIPFLVIDHLHIMDYDRSNENQEIAQITKNLKAIAKQYQMSILLLSQVNKTKEAFNINNGKSIQKPGFSNVSSDDEHKIGMNDIRGSGAPVQDAAVVMLMWQKQKSAEGTTIAINIAKNRSGANGIIDLKLLGSKYKFLEITNREEK